MVRVEPANPDSAGQLMPTRAKKSPDRLVYTVPEVAVALGINRDTAYTLIRQGKLPAIRLGRRLVIARSVLDDWLRSESAAALERSPQLRVIRTDAR